MQSNSHGRRRFLKTVPAALLGVGAVVPLIGQGPAAVPPFLSAEEARKKLPGTLAPDGFSNPQVKRAYRIAKAIPAVIAQQPCFCWCSRSGHQSLLSCYMDDHASACDMCMKEAFLAETMTRAGKSPTEIRTAIVRGDWQSAR
jgi:hypothetical protein